VFTVVKKFSTVGISLMHTQISFIRKGSHAVLNFTNEKALVVQKVRSLVLPKEVVILHRPLADITNNNVLNMGFLCVCFQLSSCSKRFVATLFVPTNVFLGIPVSKCNMLFQRVGIFEGQWAFTTTIGQFVCMGTIMLPQL